MSGITSNSSHNNYFRGWCFTSTYGLSHKPDWTNPSGDHFQCPEVGIILKEMFGLWPAKTVFSAGVVRNIIVLLQRSSLSIQLGIERKCTMEWPVACVCGATLGVGMLCDDATKQTLNLFCMSYDGRININDTVVGACPFNFDQHDTNDYYVTFPNDNYFQTKQFYVWWFESNWSVVQQMSKRYGTCCSLLQMAVCRMLW